MEFPFSLKAGALAKASEVMANLNAIKTVLEGGLTLANFAEGGATNLSQWEKNAGVTEVNAPIDLLPSGATGESLVVPVKSKVLFVVSARLFTLGGATLKAYLVLDGVEKTVAAEFTSVDFVTGTLDFAVVSADSGVFTLAAGTHTVRLVAVATTSTGSISHARVTAVMSPTT